VGLFEKFINNRLGRTVWLLLIFAFTFFVENIFIALIITAGMAWLAIDYAKQYKNSKHKKAWKIFAVILPLVTYLIYYIKIEKIVDSRKKFIFLLGSLIFIIITAWILIIINSSIDLESQYLEKNEELNDIETQAENLHVQLYQTSEINKNLQEDYIMLMNKQAQISGEMLSIIENLRSEVIYRVIPEYSNSLTIQETRLEHYVKKLKIDILWYEEQLKESPDENKLSELLQESNNEEVYLHKAISDSRADDQREYSIRNSLMNNYGILTILISLKLIGLLLAIGCFSFFVYMMKQKKLLQASFWITLFLINISSIAILVLLYF